jgi:ligand-binding sensor domain-containing protein/two-component sensor histidine kinase
MTFLKTLFAVIMLFLESGHIYAQNKNYQFKHLDTRNGLAGEEVLGFAQDTKGFIWIATDNGLQRFDGENYVTYRHNIKDSNSLSGDETFLPLFDKENNLWLNDPDECINLFNIHTGKAIKFTPEIKTREKGDNYFISYCKDRDGTVWLCSARALYRYDYTKKQPEKIALFPDSLVDYNKLGMACDTATGDIWISTKYRLIKYDKKQNIFFDFHHNPGHDAVFNLHSEPYCIYMDSRRNLWFSTWQGELFRYDPRSHYLKQYYFKTTFTSNPRSMAGGIVEDKNGNTWIGANSSDIFFYDPLKDSLELASKQFIQKPSSTQTDIVSMFCDCQDNIWIATSYGVYSFNPGKQKIFSINNDPFNNFSLPSSEVESIGESKDGLIWISSRDGGGISVFDRQMNLANRLFYKGDKIHKNTGDILVSAFCNDAGGKFWMAAFHTLIRYDPVTKKIKIWFIKELNFFVHAMEYGPDGVLWIGGGNSIVQINTRTRVKKIFSFPLLPQSPDEPKEIRDILFDPGNNIWVATLGGLFHFDLSTGKVDASYSHHENDMHSLCNDKCQNLAIYHDSILLTATGNGLSVFNTHSKQFSTIYNSEGILSNNIHGVSTDKNGNIFTSTTNGLYEIDHNTHAYTLYSYEDGISDNQFYTRIFTLSDGRMLAGGLNSFIYFTPGDLKKTSVPPDVQITGYKIFDTQFSTDSLYPVRLAYDKNFITIQYASLYYNSPAKIRYYYQLKGVDKDWVDAGNKKSASYTGLDDGSYIFLVKCVNNNGIASANITRMYITIAPPFYKSWWFILLCILAVLIVCYFIYDFRRSSRISLAKVRNRIASDLHDDIGSTLNSISVFSEVATQQLSGNTELTKTILEKMGSASRGMIDKMNDIVWALNPKNDDFKNILQRMQYFAADILSGKNILLSFEVDEKVQKIKMPMEKRKNFYLIYKEAINNTYKYAESQKVHVSISEKEGKLVMVVDDNGKGFDITATSKNGNGLKNMQERAKEIHAKFDITSLPGKGTRIYLQMKI